jgi:hypothetical protein
MGHIPPGLSASPNPVEQVWRLGNFETGYSKGKKRLRMSQRSHFSNGLHQKPFR